MLKLRKISDITATLPFTEFDFMQKYRESFAVSEHRQANLHFGNGVKLAFSYASCNLDNSSIKAGRRGVRAFCSAMILSTSVLPPCLINFRSRFTPSQYELRFDACWKKCLTHDAYNRISSSLYRSQTCRGASSRL